MLIQDHAAHAQRGIEAQICRIQTGILHSHFLAPMRAVHTTTRMMALDRCLHRHPGFSHEWFTLAVLSIRLVLPSQLVMTYSQPPLGLPPEMPTLQIFRHPCPPACAKPGQKAPSPERLLWFHSTLSRSSSIPHPFLPHSVRDQGTLPLSGRVPARAQLLEWISMHQVSFFNFLFLQN